MDGFRIDGLRTALGLNENGRLLAGSHTLVITGRVLVVIEPGQNGAVTLLDYGMVDTGCKNDLGGVTAFTATAGTAGKFSAGNLGTRLVPQGQGYGIGFLVNFGIKAEHRAGFQFCQPGGYRGILDGVSGIWVKSLINLNLVNLKVDIAVTVLGLTDTVHRNAFNGITATVTLPTGRI